MNKITLHFDNIAKQRKFEAGLQFLGISYEENDSDHTILIDISDVPIHLKVEVSGATGPSITFRNDEAA